MRRAHGNTPPKPHMPMPKKPENSCRQVGGTPTVGGETGCEDSLGIKKHLARDAIGGHFTTEEQTNNPDFFAAWTPDQATAAAGVTPSHACGELVTKLAPVGPP